MSVLVIAEHDNKKLLPVTLSVITAAKSLAAEITVIVIGHQCQSVAAEVARLNGVTMVLLADHEIYAHPLAENITPLILSIAKDFSHIIAPATSLGKNVLPRLAALLDVSVVSDVIQIIDDTHFIRPIYAGNALLQLAVIKKPVVMTVRHTAFSATETQATATTIKMIDAVMPTEKVQFVQQQLTPAERPELTSARVIIAGGRGLQTAENFALLMRIADLLGAAVGASRAAVDAGLMPNDFQVGQTGKIVAPELYVAVGISGAIQHLAGMKDSKVIVAINKDPEAPIFQIADYGLVGDLNEILPELERVLTARKST